MSEQTPSQAEGERPEDEVRANFPRSTPSQAEGEREEEPEPQAEDTPAQDRRGPKD
ncbi:hypothetical protein GLX30_32575 [Streptomyces sp. Tu 2975]|uniref:hypothetical protein n=1 Tax=Streptomyces sp. Tu 2975 TaxID=2676871 RepID=UPI001413D3F8|nr:hypothetical protein [Streptomyces sp. Tu 2975]QIP87971.1 hypothetical protein GLX30_32575 [Streptomyces sp. Tu 2975]